MMAAFLIDQVQRRCDELFEEAGPKCASWEAIRHLSFPAKVGSMRTTHEPIAFGHEQPWLQARVEQTRAGMRHQTLRSRHPRRGKISWASIWNAHWKGCASTGKNQRRGKKERPTNVSLGSVRLDWLVGASFVASCFPVLHPPGIAATRTAFPATSYR